LHTNYRNSAEIFAVAGRVIRQEFPSLELPNAVRATGIEPSHVPAGEPELSSSVRAAVESLLGEVAGTVGVIVATHRVEQVADWLEGLDPDRVGIITALASKGLEYDGVVVVEPAEIVAESTTGIRTLYVVLTRATQRLITVGAEGVWSG
jgi:DNA helicase IV